jgi:hypothetical protein
LFLYVLNNLLLQEILVTLAGLQPGSRIDEFLPNPDFAAAYEIPIHAPVSLVYERLLALDITASPIVRLLLSLRTGGRVRRPSGPGDFSRRFAGTRFVILAEVPDEEVVIGVAGRFWRPGGGRRLGLKPGDFIAFSRAGHAKAAMNFRMRSHSQGRTLLATETRIACFGPAAWWKFRLYWAVVAPFSGVIRRAILKQIRVEAERDGKELLRMPWLRRS